MKTTSSPTPKKCFSYVRYSSARQGKEFGGSSEWRQAEIAPRVAKEKGWELVEEWAMEDLGKSAFKGDNVKTLKSIIQKAAEGIIPQGTVCIIETMDRYSRLKLDDAYQLLRELLKSGIELYVDRTGRHLTQEALNKPMEVMMLVVEIDASFQYADSLANKVRKSWKMKRETDGGKKNKDGSFKKNVPAWIDAKTWTVIEEKRKVLNRIFNMFLNGNGVTHICHVLNAEKVPTFGGGTYWNTTYIGDLFMNGLVIGERKHETRQNGKRIPTGEVTKGFYPAAINENIYYQVKGKYAANLKSCVRKNDNIANVFAGVAYCTCGERMNKINGRVKSYIGCKGHLNKLGCQQPLAEYGPIEQSFLYIVGKNPELFVVKNETSVNDLRAIQGKIESTNKQIQNITDAVVNGMATKALTLRQGELEKQLEELELELNIAKSKSVATKNNGKEIERVTSNLAHFGTDTELRQIVRDYCLTHFKAMEFDNANQYYTVTFNKGNQLRFELLGNGQRTEPIDGGIRIINDVEYRLSTRETEKEKFTVEGTGKTELFCELTKAER